jgi:hypothetical protein
MLVTQVIIGHHQQLYVDKYNSSPCATMQLSMGKPWISKCGPQDTFITTRLKALTYKNVNISRTL